RSKALEARDPEARHRSAGVGAARGPLRRRRRDRRRLGRERARGGVRQGCQEGGRGLMAGIDSDPSVDHYKLLGVASPADADDIKKGYRKLAKANHPDSRGGDKAKEQRFKEISNAYDVPGEPKKREQYDAIRAGGFRTGPGGPQGNPFAGAQAGGQVWDLGDLFGQMFSGGGGRGPGRVRVERFDFGGPGFYEEEQPRRDGRRA